MKLFELVFTAALCLGVGAPSRLSNKYLPIHFAVVGTADSGQYRPSHGAMPRISSHIDHQYAGAAVSPVHVVPHRGKNTAATRVPILRNDFSNDGSGNYNFVFETGHGIKRDESGHIQGAWPKGSLKVTGSYSYTGDDGKLYSVNYKADSNGFLAEGDHLPTPPPIPREIQQTLHLHQHAGSSATGHSTLGHHSPSRILAVSSQQSAVNLLAPSANYLPPHQGQGYNYGRHY